MFGYFLFTELFRNIETKRFFPNSWNIGCCSRFYVFGWLCLWTVVAIQCGVGCVGVVVGWILNLWIVEEIVLCYFWRVIDIFRGSECIFNWRVWFSFKSCLNWLNIGRGVFILSLISKNFLNRRWYLCWWKIEWRKLVPVISFCLIFQWRWFLISGRWRIRFYFYIKVIIITQIRLDIRRRRFEFTDSRFTVSLNIIFIGW